MDGRSRQDPAYRFATERAARKGGPFQFRSARKGGPPSSDSPLKRCSSLASGGWELAGGYPPGQLALLTLGVPQ